MNLWFFGYFCNQNGVFTKIHFGPTIQKSKKIEKNSFSQNRLYTCSDGKYAFKTCLGHQGDSFRAIYHHFESLKGFFQKLDFCQKCDFLAFFGIFDLWDIFRFFLQNRSKITLETFKSFFESPNIPQIQWITSHDDLKTI